MLNSPDSDSSAQIDTLDIFPWDDNFNTGLAKVDEQHRRLVQLLNQLADHVAFRINAPQLNEIFDALSDYAVYHFQTEETIWHTFFVDDVSELEHREAHASFVSEIQRLKAEQASKPDFQVYEDTLDFLARWLAAHILESDRYMAYTVLAIRDGMALDQAKLHAKQQMEGTTRTLIDIILSIYSTLSANTLRLMRELVEHREAKIELIRESERNQALLRLASDGIHILDRHGNLVEASNSFCTMLGYSHEDVRGMNVAEWDIGFSPEELGQKLQQILTSANGFEFQTRHRRKDGGIIDVEVTAISIRIGDTPLVFASSRDITHRKQAERALRESEKRFYDIALISADWIWEVDAHGHYTYASDSVHALLGYRPDELMGKTPFDLMPPEEAKRVAASFAGNAVAKSCFRNLENIVLAKNGDPRVMLTNGTPILDNEGNLLGYRGVDRDITAQRQAEKALIESRNLLKTIIDTVPVRIFWKDKDLCYLGCNPIFAKDAGKDDPEDLIGKNDFHMPWVANAEGYRADDRKIIDTGVAQLAYEELQTTPDGHLIVLRTSKVPLKNADHEIIGVLGIYDDITEFKKTETELHLTAKRLNKAQRMAQIGSWELDLVTDKLTWSDEVFRIFELDKQRIEPNYEVFLQAIHPDGGRR